MGVVRRLLAAIAAVAAFAVVAVPNTGAQPPVGTTELFEFGDALGADLNSAGLPVLLAREYTYDPDLFTEEQSTFLVQCTAVDCSGDSIINEIMFVVPSGNGEQLRLDPFDRPVIASFDSGDDELDVYSCGDPTCASWERHTVVVGDGGGSSSNGGFVKDVVAMEFAPDGALHVVVNRPDLDFGDSAAHVRCSDATCAEAQVTGIDAGLVTSMVLDPAALPAYTVAEQLVRCGDPTCTSTTVGELPGFGMGVTFGRSGFPLVLVANRIFLEAEFPRETYGLLLHCDDPLCVDEEQHAHRVVEASVETSHRHSNIPLSVHIGPYGLPVVGRYFNPGFDGESEQNEFYEFHAECAAVHCAGPTNDAADRFWIGRRYSEFPTYFLTTPDDTPVVFSAGQSPFDFPDHTTVEVTACIPGAACFPDDNGNGLPDWSESADPVMCRDDVVTVNIALGQMPTPGDDVIMGTAGIDVIAAGDGDDVICGGGGDDIVWGQGGDDTIYGDEGDDKLRGGDGEDLLFGGGGSDDLNGGRDNDEVWGQDGADVSVRGGTGDDLVNGGPGDDVIVAGNGGSDVVHGASGADKVTGGPRPDEVRGGAGPDTVKGNNGADSVYGDTGNDELFGGPGGDTLVGGADTDVCNGGAGDDSTASCETLVNIP